MTCMPSYNTKYTLLTKGCVPNATLVFVKANPYWILWFPRVSLWLCIHNYWLPLSPIRYCSWEWWWIIGAGRTAPGCTATGHGGSQVERRPLCSLAHNNWCFSLMNGIGTTPERWSLYSGAPGPKRGEDCEKVSKLGCWAVYSERQGRVLVRI